MENISQEEIAMKTDAHARKFFERDIYQFDELEQRVLKLFFTNSSRPVFLMHTLPMTVGDVLLSMYSRLKNSRGLRGVLVDNFLPQLFASSLPEVEEKFDGKPIRFLNTNGLTSLGKFASYSSEAAELLEEFLKAMAVDTEYIQKFSESRKVKMFLEDWLDKYGHNSIARMAGGIWICFEQISILAAKTIEWTRPGSGYIELSTRYVDMAGKDVYPAAEEIAAYGVDIEEVQKLIDDSFAFYRKLQGENLDGAFPAFLRSAYAHLFADSPKDLEAGIFGETCDVLGNLLPAVTLTSVGVSTSGEALPQLVKHLLLDNTPETRTLAALIAEEGKRLGVQQFMRHTEPTPWEKAAWEYLDPSTFGQLGDEALVPSAVIRSNLPPAEWVEEALSQTFRGQKRFHAAGNFQDVVKELCKVPRGSYDKLPNHFEKVAASFEGVMSFRGWRDMHRQGFSVHYRTLLTPELGFYFYDKTAPQEFFDACRDIHARNLALYRKMVEKGVPPELMQYPLALGNLIGFHFGGNLLQIEFSNWQRTKYSVNHEVRQIFLGYEEHLRKAYSWWKDVSRADTEPAYVFARGDKEVPLR